MTPPIRGSLTPLVTPFRNGAIDEAGFIGLVDHQFENGGHGITVAGTTGEPASLTSDERIRLFELAVSASSGRGVVLAGAGTNEQRETLLLARAAARCGASAALVVTPYFVQPNQDGLRAWFTTVADAAEIPVILYDIPGRSGVGLSVETTTTLAQHPNIVGVKLARPDLVHASNVIAACGSDFGVYSGVEALSFPILILGGAGLISATGNLFPSELAAMAEAAFAGDIETARDIHYRLLDVNEAIFFDTNPIPIKTMLGLAGYIAPEVRPPLASASEALRARLEKLVADHGLLGRASGEAGSAD